MADFSEFLDKDVADIERPPTLPEGEYEMVIMKKDFGKSAKKSTPFVEFHFNILNAKESVDSDALEGIDLAKQKPKVQFYLTEDALFRLKEFGEIAGVNETKLGDMIDGCVGQTVVGTCSHTHATDGTERVFTNFNKFAPV